MATCDNCNTQFDLSATRAEYEAEFDDKLKYNEGFPENDICAACAMSNTGNDLAVSLEIDFSLTTGMPLGDMRDDWEMHDGENYLYGDAARVQGTRDHAPRTGVRCRSVA